ncbi:hypothetical protein, partial [Sphingomonas sanguinis]|uniref:hypothetical protein n=1 Tax=Sphingomonas sanguinis TaxID=33051 RepID=UPI000A6E1FCC
MTTIAHAPLAARSRNRWLKDAAGRRDGASGLLLLDTLAATGFAAGLAGGVTAVAASVSSGHRPASDPPSRAQEPESHLLCRCLPDNNKTQTPGS